jgi:peptidylprolyl isomerase
MRLKLAVALAAGLFAVSPLAAQTIIPPAPLVGRRLVRRTSLHLDLSTGGGVSSSLRPDVAPQHVARIKTLARQGLLQRRHVPPRDRGLHGLKPATRPGPEAADRRCRLPAEFNGLPHVRGAVSLPARRRRTARTVSSSSSSRRG